MVAELRIAEDLALPLDLVTQKTAILARSGAGKTNTAVVIAEEVLAAGQQLVILDPPGAWWGLRSSADGRAAGYPIVVLGGEHGDLGLAPQQGEAVADFVVDRGASVILDLSDFSLAETARFATAFGQQLYGRKARERTPLLLVIEEADELAPQNVRSEQARMVGAYERIVKRGRMRGIGTLLISQRSAALNKHLLSQVGTLIALQTTDPRDIKAIDEWVERQGDEGRRRQMLAEIASLPIGTGFLYSPGWLREFRRVAFRRRRTFDSSATPEVGQAVVAPKRLADVDLDALRAALATASEDKKSEPPSELRRQVAELKRRLAERPTAPLLPPPEPDTRLLEELEAAHLLPELQEAAAVLREAADRLDALQAKAHAAIVAAHARAESDRADPRPASRMQKAQPITDRPQRDVRAVRGLPPSPPPPPPSPAPVSTPSPSPNGVLGEGERRILIALAQFAEGRSRRQVALLARYAIGGGAFSAALSALRRREHLEAITGGYRITPGGQAALGDWEPLPTGAALREYWLGHLGAGEARILRAVLEMYPQGLPRQEVADAAGMVARGGAFGSALAHLRALDLVEGSRALRAADALFEGG